MSIGAGFLGLGMPTMRVGHCRPRQLNLLDCPSDAWGSRVRWAISCVATRGPLGGFARDCAQIA